jgi:hypothetical protein
MDFLKGLSDDQFALLGCAVALVSTGSLMTLSYFIGPGRALAAARALRAADASAAGAEAAHGSAESSRRRSAA